MWIPSPCFLTHRQEERLMAVVYSCTAKQWESAIYRWKLRCDYSRLLRLYQGMDLERNSSRKSWLSLLQFIWLWWARRVTAIFFSVHGLSKGIFFCRYVFPSSWGSGIISEWYIEKEEFVFIQLLIYSLTVYTYTRDIYWVPAGTCAKLRD